MSLVLGLIRGFFRFWYDFIIGDCWQIAAGVVVVLVAAILLVRTQAVPHTSLPFIVAAAIMILVVLSTLLELRTKATGQH
ncbi:MAG: hypothetical protein ABSD48_07255 [Armatimonadota bacterium]|jgi:hypothetical protein